jgi:hypothetical protein
MERFLSDEALWKELRSLSKGRKRRLLVAVPYVGSDTRELLHFQRGDVLVVALTIANARCGAVCPAEIDRLQQKGVLVFLAPDLHAKVILCGNKAVVGSANLSQSSLKYRDEAAIITTAPEVVRSVRDWFGQRTSEPITPEWLSICAKAYRPPKPDEAFNRRPKVTRNVRQRMGRGVWLVGLSPMDEYPEDEAPIHERGQEEAEKYITDRGKYEIRPARFVGGSRLVENIRRGDSWIAVWKDGREHYAEEPARVTSWRKGKNKTGKIVTYIYVETSRRPKRVGWGEFKVGCRRTGLKLGRHVVYREISDPQQAAKILMLVSKKRVRP